MIFYESVCFDITVMGEKAHVDKLVSYLKSGELDSFFAIEDDFFAFDDNYATANPSDEVSVGFSEEFGVEVEEFDPDEFLEILCKVGKPLHIKGSFYNFDDDEIRFVSEAGNAYYANSDGFAEFNDELDAEAKKEDAEEDSDY